MEPVRIVRAGAADALLVAALVLQMQRAKGADPDPDFLQRTGEAWQARRRDLPTWIAERHGEHAGFVQLAVVPDPLGRRTRGWLFPPFVRPDHRGDGVGPALIHAATDWAKGAGLRLVIAEPEAPDEATYAQRGFTIIEPGLALRRFG
ncbi:GNAT family N-acetyltransferase [Janibacter sp. GXQ6167]|uniref:GNAT family N-acetyltransferase n=1 Tax=Janibacter sp. GXQ6167 TaxID=3240791 RepID=UPI0035233A55